MLGPHRRQGDTSEMGTLHLQSLMDGVSALGYAVCELCVTAAGAKGRKTRLGCGPSHRINL